MTLASLRRVSFAAALNILPAIAFADVITDWNERALAAVAAASQLPPDAARTMAIVHVSMFDAVNSIERRYTPYRVRHAAPAGSSAEAAAVAAAHTALTTLFPGQRSALDVAYTASLAQIADSAGKTAGITLGERVAAEIIAARATDGANRDIAYRPPTTPGNYVPTVTPVSLQWGRVTPWAMDSGAQFRPAPPPALTSPDWARDYAEIRDWGGRTSASRTQEHTNIARFWAVTGPASWDPLVRGLASAPGRRLVDNARLFALVEMAASDAFIAVFDAKYTFNFWRPVTAIRNGDIDGNDATERVADWESLIPTPLHPEYPCAHCITSSAVGVVLEAEFGAGPIQVGPFASPTARDVVRQWTTIRAYVDEVAMARIYGGVHYRNSARVGLEMGRQIGALVVARQLRPIQ